MAAGVSKTLWSTVDIVALIDARAEPAKPSAPYKTKARLAVRAAENSN